MLFFVKWKYLLKAARTCARSCTLLEAPTKSRKLCVAGHHDEVQRSELRGQENLVWNIGPIETMELRKPDWSGCTGPVQWRGAPRISKSSRSRTSSMTMCSG